MRNPSDRLLVAINMTTIADLDWERIEEDPTWELILAGSPNRETALEKYISHYLRQTLLFTNMPCTNGPSSIYIESLEVKNVDEQQ